MRLTYISESTIPSRHANGFQVMKMCEAFTLEGADVELLAPDVAGMGRGDAAHGPIDEGLRDHYGITTPFSMRWIDASGPGLYGYGLRAARHARTRRSDLVYGRHLAGVYLAARAGIPTLLEVHQVPQGRIAPHVFRRLVTRPQLRAVVVISHALKQRMGPVLGALHVAPDGVDPERFAAKASPAAARAALGLSPRAFTAGYAGHLYPGRGVETILALAERLPEIRFLVIGGREDDLAAWRRDERLRRCDNLRLVGFVPNAQLPRWLAACDTLLMPYASRVQVAGGGDTAGWMSPLKMFEYMATGRLILSSDLPALREVLNERNAALCPAEDVGAWHDALRRAQGDASWRETLGRQAQRDVAAFSWGARARALLELADLA